MTIAKQFSKGVAWMAAGNWAEQAVNFVVFLILARLLNPQAFGLLAMASAFVVLAEFLVRESLTEFLIAEPDPEPGHFNAVFWLLAGFGALLTLVLILAAGPIATFFGEDSVRGLIRAMSPTILMIALTAVPVTVLRRQMRFKTLSLRAITGVFAGGVVGIGMALAGFGVWALAGQRLAQVFTNIVMAWFAVPWRPGLDARRAHFAAVMRFGGQMVGLRAAELAVTQSPNVIIGATLGAVQLGYFSIAWRLVEVASFLIATPLRLVSQPAFAALTRGGERAADLLADIARLTGPVALPAFAGLAVLSGPVLAVFFGAGWEPAAPVLSVLCALAFYLCIERVQQSFCLAAGRAAPITRLAWAEFALGAVLIWIATRWGIVAVAAGFVAARYMLWILRFRIVAGIGGIAVFDLIGIHARPLAAALVMAAAVFAVQKPLTAISPLLGLGGGILSGFVIYGLLSALFMRDRLALMKTYMTGRHGDGPPAS